LFGFLLSHDKLGISKERGVVRNLIDHLADTMTRITSLGRKRTYNEAEFNNVFENKGNESAPAAEEPVDQPKKKKRKYEHEKEKRHEKRALKATNEAPKKGWGRSEEIRGKFRIPSRGRYNGFVQLVPRHLRPVDSDVYRIGWRIQHASHVGTRGTLRGIVPRMKLVASRPKPGWVSAIGVS
jgi:hypothetical protein